MRIIIAVIATFLAIIAAIFLGFYLGRNSSNTNSFELKELLFEKDKQQTNEQKTTETKDNVPDSSGLPGKFENTEKVEKGNQEEFEIGDCGEDCNTDNWKIYRNKKYGYSFRYSPDFILTDKCKHENCILEEQGGDSVSMTGDLSQRGWPLIEIRHLQNEHYNPPAGVDITEWIKTKFPWTKEYFPETANIYFTREEGHMFGGFDIKIPASSQAYARREIYYQYKGKLFEIMMLDYRSAQSKQFYDIWLNTFNVVGE